MATVTSTGLGSGLDINGIVSKLVAAEQTPQTTRFDKQEATDQAKISALGTFKSSLSDFQTAVDAMKNATSFAKMQGVSSDTSVVSASASLNAEAGDYTLTVKQLAQAHSLASRSYTNVTDVVGSGTLTIKFGTNTFDTVTGNPTGFTQNADQGTLSITLDSSNNTLTGVRDAINKAGAGVKATIINDGSGNRLVLGATSSGAKNGMEITVSDGDGDDTDAAGLSALAFNAAATPQMTQTRAAQDALVNINGLDVTSSTNTVSTALKGVTLNLLKAQPGQSINLGVSINTDAVTQAVQNFVDKFNAVVSTNTSIASYDATTQKAGVLLGDFTVQGTMRQLRNFIARPVDGLGGSVKSLLDIGISTQSDGSLALDTSKLSSALDSSPKDVAALFAPLGVPTDANVTYVGGSADTQPGDYALNVTAAATRGVLTGSAAPSLTVDADNSQLRITVDGVESGSISLTQRTYASGNELAAELQSRINGDASLKSGGASVTVQYDNTSQRFSIQSQRYGSASSVEITQVGATGSGNSVGGLDVGAGTQGTDVEATLDGQAVQGSGRQITGLTGKAKGLVLEIGDAVTGDRGSVRYSGGLVAQFDSLLTGLLDTKGTLSTRLEGLQDDVTKIGKERTDLATRMTTLQTQLLAQFNAMDKVVGQFQNTSSYLTQQLSLLPYANTKTFTG
ncbi:flagellar hook-associated protein 2 [Methylomagnum ishizawai]|uniref:Flagellar hook-associated protein 2 n=1 Tax=Methylomagnum ishizawai TaxID=1760988 RepID=A0A1Y6CZZ0_9GAMM|nr:flagellar filament capping protein FliD [Methylomagnum ishizawai]SMF95770.1 flagellar hook-associated protein 2 [Methylomagnum ishizawai]